MSPPRFIRVRNRASLVVQRPGNGSGGNNLADPTWQEFPPPIPAFLAYPPEPPRLSRWRRFVVWFLRFCHYE